MAQVEFWSYYLETFFLHLLNGKMKKYVKDRSIFMNFV